MIVLIDGRSGSGKTTLADRIAPDYGAQVVHMDDLYEGWHGLAAGSDYAYAAILKPLAEGRDAWWRPWLWSEGGRGAPRRIAAGTPLIVEGCGSITTATAQLADRSLWLECDEATRRARAASRDGDDSWWEMWRAQEDEHSALHAPAVLATARLQCC